MKNLWLIIPVSFFISCGEQSSDEPLLPEQTKVEIKGTLEERMHAFSKVELNIDASEEYTLKTYNAHLNDDGVEDIVVTVNLYDRSMKETKEKNAVKKAEMGYYGSYNFFFIIDGKSEKMSKPVTIRSNPFKSLGVSFDYITSDTHMDIMIDYHLATSFWRSFYRVVNNVPKETCISELFVNIDQQNEKAYVVELVSDDKSVSKLIAVYRAKLGAYKINQATDKFQIEPERIKTDSLERLWRYNPKVGKYYMPQ